MSLDKHREYLARGFGMVLMPTFILSALRPSMNETAPARTRTADG